MVRIDISLYGNACLFHCMQHVTAVIQDLDLSTGNNTFVIDFQRKGNLGKLKHMEIQAPRFYSNSLICNDRAVLYSNQSFAEFIQAFQENFGENDYDMCSRNCSDAVDFALKHFFPEKVPVDLCYALYQVMCFLPCLVTLGADCFPMVPCMNTPKDVFRKAILLAHTYSQEPEAASLLHSSTSYRAS